MVAAGIDSVEHGNMATDETVREMAERGTAWTPTLTTSGVAIELLAGSGSPIAARARELIELMQRTLQLAAELGVALLAGSDEAPHGTIAQEVAALCRYGVPPRAAIAAASSEARRWLGLSGFEPGAPADVVLFDADPRHDISALSRPAAVIAAGRRVVCIQPT